jgi:hypothetical protein
VSLKVNQVTLIVDKSWLDRADTLSPAQLIEKYGSVSKIYCTSDFLVCKGLFSILQKLDFILEIDGEIEIDCKACETAHGDRRRSYSQVQYAFGCMFREHYRLISRLDGKLTFRRLSARRTYSVDISGITFGFVSDGSLVDQLDRIFAMLFDAANVPIEVLLCGPEQELSGLVEKYPSIRLLPDICHDDIRPPINKKKAQIIEAATHENLVLSHDRFFFDREWFEKLGRFGNVFDFYNCRHCDWVAYPLELRVVGDWCYCHSPITSFTFESSAGSKDYGAPNPDFCLSGGLYVGKTALFREIEWPAFLNWSDMEDIHFSRQLGLHGCAIQSDFSNRVFTTAKRLGRIESVGLLRKTKRLVTSELRRIKFMMHYGIDCVD